MKMILFASEFILTNIIFSLIICTILIRLDTKEYHSILELLLYSLGLGPVLTSLLLYYLLLFFPGHSNLIYFISIILAYLTLFLFGKKGFLIFSDKITKSIKNTKSMLKNLNDDSQKRSIIISFILIIILVSFFFLALIYSLKLPIMGPDALKYGNLGKILYKERSLAYRWIRPYPKTGYYFNINHAPSFSLLLTWEKTMDSFFRKDKDLYYKSICPYYAFLILCLFLFWLSKKNKYLALLGIFLFLTAFASLQTLTSHHLDFYRIFFLIISWIYLAYVLEKKDFLSFFLLGAFSGFAAFSHTIGAVLAVINFLALFIFLNGNLKYKLNKTAFVILLTIIFGWSHYILDIFWGYGWIIFNRSITFWG